MACGVLIPLSNLLLPAGSFLQVPTYLVALWGKYVCYAILALASEINHELEPVHRVFAEPWTGPRALGHSRAIVEAYFDHWDRHRAILRSRNLSAQEGKVEFRNVSLKSGHRTTVTVEDFSGEASPPPLLPRSMFPSAR